MGNQKLTVFANNHFEKYKVLGIGKQWIHYFTEEIFESSF